MEGRVVWTSATTKSALIADRSASKAPLFSEGFVASIDIVRALFSPISDLRGGSDVVIEATLLIHAQCAVNQNRSKTFVSVTKRKNRMSDAA